MVFKLSPGGTETMLPGVVFKLSPGGTETVLRAAAWRGVTAPEEGAQRGLSLVANMTSKQEAALRARRRSMHRSSTSCGRRRAFQPVGSVCIKRAGEQVNRPTHIGMRALGQKSRQFGGHSALETRS